MFIHMAIDTLGVAPEKKAQLEKIQAALHAKMAPSREAGRNVLTLLADGVAAGKIDQAKVDAALAKQDAAAAAIHAATADALNQLHEALSPAEQQELAELEIRLAGRLTGPGDTLEERKRDEAMSRYVDETLARLDKVG